MPPCRLPMTTMPIVIRKSGKREQDGWPWSARLWGLADRDGGVWIEGSSDGCHRALRCLEAEWPQINFTLPIVQRTNAWYMSSDGYAYLGQVENLEPRDE